MFCCHFGFALPRRETAPYAAGSRAGSPPTHGNAAFEQYRVETLRRLEQEQRDFRDFLARLRIAKDRAEFEQFMAERRSRAEMPLSPA
jgi:hypothetical protein